MKRILLTLSLCIGVIAVNAQKKSIVLHYDFEKSEGKVVPDKGPFHADAMLMNNANVSNGSLVLGTDDYLDMTAKAGEVMKTLDDFTVYARYFVDSSAQIKGYGYFLWCFSVLEANKEKDGPYHAYRVNEQRCETSIGGWSQETGIQKSKVTQQGKWISVIFRQSLGNGELYIDGELVGTEHGFPYPSRIFVSAPANNWIGRAPFAGDKYLSHTKVSDFRIYNVSISDKEMKKLLKNKR